jgi:nucleoside-diphosphate-sugar epimerase
MKYFVTGATGFIGGRLARQLIADGHQVVTLARTPAKAKDLADLGVVVHAGDITDKESMRAPMTGVDGVFHIAAWYKVGVRDKSQAERINVDGTRYVLELMKELGIPKGVYTSTLAVFSDTHGQMVNEQYRHNGPWISEYDRTKWKAHYEVAEPMIKAGLPLMIVMPGAVYGPGDTSVLGDTITDYLKRRLPAAPQRSAFCFAHVDDVARGHILAMEKGKPGKTYIIAGERCSVIDLFKLAEQITRIPGPRLQPAPWMMRLGAALMQPIEALFPVPELMSAENLRVQAGVTYLGTNEKAKRELGYTPRSIENGLRETLMYEMQRLGITPAAH